MRKILVASTLVLAMSGPAFANATLDQILGGSEFNGATILKSKAKMNGFQIDVAMPDGSKIFRTYRKDGTLRSMVVQAGGERTITRYDRYGNIVESVGGVIASNDRGGSGGSGSSGGTVTRGGGGSTISGGGGGGGAAMD